MLLFSHTSSLVIPAAFRFRGNTSKVSTCYMKSAVDLLPLSVTLQEKLLKMKILWIIVQSSVLDCAVWCKGFKHILHLGTFHYLMQKPNNTLKSQTMLDEYSAKFECHFKVRCILFIDCLALHRRLMLMSADFEGRLLISEQSSRLFLSVEAIERV